MLKTTQEIQVSRLLLCLAFLLVADVQAQEGSFRINSMDMSISGTAYTKFYSLEDSSQVIKELNYSYQASADETTYTPLHRQLSAGFSDSRATASYGYEDDKVISFHLFGVSGSRGLGTLGAGSSLPAFYGVPDDTPYHSYATVTASLLIEFDLMDATDLLLSFDKAGSAPGGYYFKADPDEAWPQGSDLPSSEMRLAFQRLEGGNWVDVFQQQALPEGIFPEHAGEQYPVFASTFAQAGTYRLTIEAATEGSADGVATPSFWAQGGLYLTQVPEPGSTVLLLGGLLLCAWPRQRQAW